MMAQSMKEVPIHCHTDRNTILVNMLKTMTKQYQQKLAKNQRRVVAAVGVVAAYVNSFGNFSSVHYLYYDKICGLLHIDDSNFIYKDNFALT